MRTNGRTILTLSLLLTAICSTPLSAQTPVAPTEFRMRLYPQGSTVLSWESPSIPIGPPNTTCGLTPDAGATGMVVNPTRLQFDDPQIVGKACVLNFAGSPAAPVPDGIYDLALIGARSTVIGTVESNRVTFTKGPVTIRVISGVIFLVP